MSQFYYSVNGAQQGPVSLEQLAGWVRSGELPADTLVWKEGMEQWAPAKSVLGTAAPAPKPVQSQYPAPGAGTGYPQAGYPQGGYPQAGYPQAGYPQQQHGLSYEIPGQGIVSVTPKAMDMLRQTKPWVRFLSVLMIICIVIGGIGGLLSIVAMMNLPSRYSSTRSITAIYTVVMAVMLLLYIIPTIFLSRYASRIGDLLLRRQTSDLEAALEAQKSFWKFVGIFTLVVLCIYVLMFLLIGVTASRF